MWGGPGPDPGGTKGEGPSAGPPSSQELIDLKDQFEQQQVLIAQLKEMLRKTEQTTVTQEKVEEYANTLTRMNARAKKSKLKREGAADGKTEILTLTTTKTTTLDTPASEKIMLLRQHLEENKLKMAQRGKFQKGIEETVTQLKAQLDDSQQLISQTPLNLSLSDSRTENYSVNSSPEELFNLLVNKDRRLAEFMAKVQKLEANVLDLQENVKEKDSVIDARTKAITLMSESLSKKGKNTLDALDDTKEQMRKMQENFVTLEMGMKNEKQQLLVEVEHKNNEIEHLRTSYSALEKRCEQLQSQSATISDITASNEGITDDNKIEAFTKRIAELEKLNLELHSNVSENEQKLITELEEKNKEIEQLRQANNTLQQEVESLNNSIEQYKTDKANYELKLAEPAPSDFKPENLLSQIETLTSRVAELEELNAEISKPPGMASRDSPQRSSKKGKKGQKQTAKLKESIDSSESKIAELQKIIDSKKTECQGHIDKMSEYELTISELHSMIEELKAKQETSKPETKSAQDNEEITKLKKQLDESNKNMIKIKAQHKGKLKELNKKIEELKKGTDNTVVLQLQTENAELNKRINLLEEEKINLSRDVDSANSNKDFAASERVKELEMKLFEQLELSNAKDQSVTTLEEQIKSYKIEIESLNERFEKLSNLENAQVVSEITSIHFEEQLDKLEMEKKALIQEKECIIREKEEQIETLTKDKQEISGKLDSYMQENMELIDKLEKLSAEKVSSAESIEIVEGLTQQEKLELEAYHKSLEMTSDNIKNSDENLDHNPELNESVNQLTEETSDLLRKIELFTEERREVMEKMEALTLENNQLNMKIQEIENNRDILADTYEQLQNEKEDLETKLENEKERIKGLETNLHNKIEELKTENQILKEQMGDQEIKHGSEVEETVKLETVTPLAAASNEKSNELQKQIDEYKSLIEFQKQEIHELKVELLSHRDLSIANSELHEKVTTLQKQYESLLSENEKLNKTIKETSEMVHEKDAIESELITARKRISEFDEKLTNNLNEIENYKSIIEENKDELISSANLITDLQSKLDEKQNEISHYESEVRHLNSVIAELNSAVSHLENENQQNNENNTTMELMSNQLQELKALLNENIKQIEEYEAELQQNSDTIVQLTTQLKGLSNKMLEMEHELECKDDEIKKLVKERDNKETMIANLQDELKQKDENFHKICGDLKEKYLSLQNQIEQNAGSLDNIKNPLSKVEELESKNKEQLEKMKKIAANLKKKTAAYQELDGKYKQITEKWEIEEKEKLQLKEVVNTQETKIQSLLEQLHEMEKECSALQATLMLKNNEFDSLTEDVAQLKADVMELQNLKQQYELQLNALTASESNMLNIEINEKNEIIKNLTQQLETIQYTSATNSNALHAKIQELEMFIETQEAELTKYRDKANRLEEGLSTVEERRLSLERRTEELGAQLLEKSNSYEEISQTEDLLEQRLAALMVHDEKIERHLREANRENQELAERNRFLFEENDQLKHKLSAATERNLDVSASLDKMDDLQNENVRLSEIVANLESESKRLHVEFEKRLSDKKNEIETLEIELQGQLVQLDNERKTLLIQCEQLNDQVKEYSENQELLKEEIDQYRQKLEQQQVDFDAHIIEFQHVTDENNKSLSIIERLNSQMPVSQTSDIEDSNKMIDNLQKLLAEKISEIENYQRQNLQLQMQGAFGHTHETDILGQSSVQNDFQRVNDELQLAKNQIAEFERNNSDLKLRNSELLEKISATEKQNIANKIIDTPQKSAQEQSVSTFVWPEEPGNDPFDFVINPVANQPQNVEPPIQAVVESQLGAQNTLASNLSENTKEELLNKIKTLEFMLYNVEYEKEDVLSQCLELTNEVARLIYEKQNKTASQSSSDQLPVEEQIISTEEATITKEDLKQLQKVEFEKTKPGEDSVKGQPVTEDLLEPKTAYLCYQLEAPPTGSETTHPQEFRQVQVDSQIISDNEATITAEDLQQLHGVEFETTKDVKDAANSTRVQPVLEDVMESKTTYLCYKPEKQPEEASGHQATINLDVFDENDDGWGCGLEEAKLEEDYRRTTSGFRMNQNPNIQIEELDEKIRVLELERERHLEVIKQAQIKSGKLIKKLKEFKALNEKLSSDLKKSSDFSGLDDAIQDELQSQVARLEKRVKETSAELEKDKVEKSNWAKKIDMLQAANERLIDMKEKQDVEMLSWQRQNRELKEKLEQLEWGDDGFDSPKHSKSEQQHAGGDTNVDVQNREKKIQNLTDTVKELTLDNEELQAMLEEQRTLRINMEKAKSVEPMAENMKTEAEYLVVVTERNNLNDQLISSVEEKKNLQEQLNNLIKSNGELQHNLQHLTEEQSQLQNQLAQNNDITQELNNQLHNLQKQNENLVQTSQITQSNELEEAKIKIESLGQENVELNNRLQTLEVTIRQLETENTNVVELQNNISMLGQEKIELFNALQEKNVSIENLNESVSEYQQKITDLEDKLNQSQTVADESKILTEKLQSKENDLVEVRSKLETALQERSALTESIEQLTDEWNQRVDQRGTDVAESWKLHLDSRESEFMQSEQQLRKEINELEEKCNALVNENNELRKNVDAEIRNEVDRISALQQQINDRQHYINDLTRVVQENQSEMEQQRQKLAEHENITLQLNNQIQEKSDKISEFETLVSKLQSEIQEKSKSIEELTEKLHEFEIFKQKFDGNQQTITTLQNELHEKESIINEFIGKFDKADIELNQYKETYSLLQQQLHEKDTYIYETTNKLKQIEAQKQSETNSNVKTLQQQVNDLNLQLQEKQMQIESLTQQIYSNQQYSTSVETKNAEIQDLIGENERANLLLQEKQMQIETLTQELSNYQSVTENIGAKETEINQLNMEIANLKWLLNEKENEYAHTLATTAQENESVFSEKAQELDAVRRRQGEAEYHFEELLSAKDADVENLRLQLLEQMQKNETLTKDYQEQEDTLDDFKTQLDIKVQECEELQNRVDEQNVLHNEENKQLSEVRQIIEDQVLKIELLKQELFDKSKHYDSLIAELDIRKPSRYEPGTPPQESQEQFQMQASKSETPVKQEYLEDSALEPISRAELDLALYMLHQRDVRCEELTVELMQLLEERDTLQLKLSNSIREKEELRSRFMSSSPTPEVTETEVTQAKGSPTGTVPKSKTSAIVLGATGTELATEATESLHDIKEMDRLADKLSELKSVGYRRDKTLLDEQEQRRYQQLSLMQQHRDVAAMLPPEAAARLVQEASYTLSRDVQSPSKVLLDWLWGRSTPKVNNI